MNIPHLVLPLIIGVPSTVAIKHWAGPIGIPLALAVLYFGWRWIVRTGKKENAQLIDSNSSGKGTQIETRKNHESMIERYEAAATRSPKPDHNTVRLLVAYDAAGEFGKVKTLIQRLDGEEFSESVAEELLILAGNYFPIELEPTKTAFDSTLHN